MPVFPSPPPRRIYQRNPLKLVVCQLRFPVLQEFESPGFLAPFQTRLLDDYPRSSLEQQLGFAVGPGGAASMPAQQHWRFRGLEDGWSVALGRDFVSLEASDYDRFETFRARLTLVLDSLPLLGVRVRERIGLRYVNEIRHPDAKSASDWPQYIEQQMLGMVGGADLNDRLIHAVTDIRLRDDGDVMVIRHGYVGPQGEDNECFYLLDVDVFDERPIAFDPGQTKEQLDRFHAKADSVWESTITEALRHHFGVIEGSS
jgi:uncharacterized protein (TIGR04255 family)